MNKRIALILLLADDKEMSEVGSKVVKPIPDNGWFAYSNSDRAFTLRVYVHVYVYVYFTP